MSEFKRVRPLLGTFLDIRVHGGESAAAHDALQLAFAEGVRLEQIFSTHNIASELGRWNTLSWCDVVEFGNGPSTEFIELLAAARKLTCISHGSFTPWWRSPDWLDLSGMAKGYIVDCLVAHLEKNSLFKGGSVNAGGDIRFFGQVHRNVALRFGHGPDARSRPMEIALDAVATSSLAIAANDPESTTRYATPLRAGLSAAHTVTAIAHSAAVADGLTKVGLFGETGCVQNACQEYGATILVFAPNGELVESYHPV